MVPTLYFLLYQKSTLESMYKYTFKFGYNVNFGPVSKTELDMILDQVHYPMRLICRNIWHSSPHHFVSRLRPFLNLAAGTNHNLRSLEIFQQ